MNFKWIFLFFILGLPICIYLFLQSFGKNKFYVPIYYEQGIVEPIGSCISTSGQFKVPVLTEFEGMSGKDASGITILDISSSNCDSSQHKLNNLYSLWDRYKDWNEFSIQSLVEVETEGLYTQSKPGWCIYYGSTIALKELANCGLNLELVHATESHINKNGMVVLIDDQRRIRGYYNVFDRKETDRLAVELEILRNSI